MQELKVQFYGKVQKVGFRSTAKKLAELYGVKGYVQNRSDGSVFLLAQAEEQILERFLKHLEEIFAISHSTKESRKAETPLQDFAIYSTTPPDSQ